MTAGEQVEKVAKALFAWDIQEHEEPRPTWEGSEGMREVFRSGATVAIAAMQPEPVTNECAVRASELDTFARFAKRLYPPSLVPRAVIIADLAEHAARHRRGTCDHPTPTPQADVLAEVRTQALKDAADDLDHLQFAHDVAECAGHVEGEVGRSEAIGNWLSVCDDPQTWLRHRAGDTLIPDAFVPLTVGTILCADGLHEECHDHESCQCGCHMTITPGAILDKHEANS